ncbi:MAG TPA: hypothetical protein PLW44_10335 [Chitinophagales bacterium]|nr:hypothetical protein [Chitinophagales bacterium]
MIAITTRPISDEEKQMLLKQLRGVYTRIEDFVLKFISVVFVLLSPFLVYDHFSPVSSNIQLVYCIAVVLIAIAATIWLTIKWEGGFSNAKQIAAITNAMVEVVHVNASRVIERKDPEDFGLAYYVEVFENSKPKTLFLWGQYFYELDEALFPNTEFEFIRLKGSGEFISFKTLGHYFKEEKVLPPFTEEIFKSGNYPTNGQVLDVVLDEIE